MPTRAARFCAHPGCKRIVLGGRCPTHQLLAEEREAQRKRALDSERPAPADRGYDSAWRAVRRQFLEANPMCVGFGEVEGRCGQRATDVDHVVAVADAPELRLKWSNLRPYCHRCHSARTARDQGFGKARAAATTVPTTHPRMGDDPPQ